MAKGSIGDEFDILGYFIGFWLFVFSKSFREIWVSEFKKSNWFGKFFDIIGAISSIIFGVLTPIGLIYFIFIK